MSVVQQGTPGTQTIRVQSAAGQMVKQGGTVMQGAQGKQIIVHKGGAPVPGSQPQIVTLVKTTQGMQVAPVRTQTPLCMGHCHLSVKTLPRLVYATASHVDTFFYRGKICHMELLSSNL